MIEPVVVMVPALTVTRQMRLKVPLPGMAMLAAVSVPSPTLIVEVVAELGAVMVTAPVTASVMPELMAIPFAPDAFAAMVTVLAAAAATTVTVCVLAIVTSSPEPGDTPPTQVEPTSQLPLWLDAIAAARALPAEANATATASAIASALEWAGSRRLAKPAAAPVPAPVPAPVSAPV
ncbi:MAG: hypothetical protein ACRDL7_01525, partial [Gaiellaceae bacterium]